MRRIQIVYFEAGGGHRSAARSLTDAIRLEGWPWIVEPVNLDDLLEPADLVRKTTGLGGPDWYNWSLRRGWTSAPARLMPAVRGYIRAMHTHYVRLLRGHWRRTAPDLVVSVMPHYNRSLFDSLRDELPHVPMATILTDFADCPPHFWFERQDQHFICGSSRSCRQALALGIPRDRVRRVSGMIVHPRFYAPRPFDRAGERAAIGLSPDAPTALVMFGGHGSARILAIVKHLADGDAKWQLIVVCGHNQRLVRILQTSRVPYPMHVEGFTTDIDRLMRLSDVFVGKPGPGSVSEAITAGLPVIVEHDSATMPQERHTVDWILETRTGIVLPAFAQLGPALEQMLDPGIRAGFRERVRSARTNAVFEIPPILDRIISGPASPLLADSAVAI